MSGPSPGPWEVEGTGLRAVVRASNGVIVAVRHRQPKDEHEANARLIAAAPDMLAALQTALLEMQTCRCDGTDYAINEVEAAIAKAAGNE